MASSSMAANRSKDREREFFTAITMRHDYFVTLLLRNRFDIVAHLSSYSFRKREGNGVLQTGNRFLTTGCW
jgi:hypothetical protein